MDLGHQQSRCRPSPVGRKIDGKRLYMDTDGMAVAIQPAASSGVDDALHEFIKPVTMYEMSRALGVLWHNNSTRNIMYPQIMPNSRAALRNTTPGLWKRCMHCQSGLWAMGYGLWAMVQ